jgi:hypothetical protein
MSHVKTLLGLAITVCLTITACGGGGGTARTSCDPTATPTGCSGDYQCEVVAGATDGGALGRCYPPAYLDVTVLDPTDGNNPVGGARVVVVDADTGEAAAPAGTTSSNGVARIAVVWPRTDPDLDPGHSFHVRVSAVGYLDYPGATRASIPVSVSRDPLKSLEPVGATITILPLANPPKGSITGSVLHADGKTPARGVLVVAEDSNAVPPVGQSSVSDAAGEFAIYNVESRSYVVSAYFAGASFPSSPVSVSGAEVHAKVIADASPALATVTGQVNIVATSAKTQATVVLRIASTRDVVPGLVTTATSGTPFTITGAATGTYEAVAGWGNDGLVLDPDTNIGQTGGQVVTVLGTSPPTTVALADHFKVTDAVAILGPGQSGDVTLVNGTPTFRWQKYPQADFYIVKVWDGMSPDPIWLADSRTVDMTSETVAYPGTPALLSGYFYQWWVEAWASAPTERPLSHSEELLGVFEYIEQ